MMGHEDTEMLVICETPKLYKSSFIWFLVLTSKGNLQDNWWMGGPLNIFIIMDVVLC